MAEILDVTDDSFLREVIESDVPVLVDFWGDHCPACRQISPILRDLAESAAGRFKVVKVHATENAGTAARYGVRAMPTVFAFAAGTVRGQLVGARPRSDFEALIEQARG
jgi:thioredoxin 1